MTLDATADWLAAWGGRLRLPASELPSQPHVCLLCQTHGHPPTAGWFWVGLQELQSKASMPTPRSAGGAGLISAVVVAVAFAVTTDALTDWWGALMERWMPLAFVALSLAVALWSMASKEDEAAPSTRIPEAHSTCGGSGAMGSGSGCDSRSRGGAGTGSRCQWTPAPAMQPLPESGSRGGAFSRWLRSWASPGGSADAPPTIEMSSLGGGSG